MDASQIWRKWIPGRYPSVPQETGTPITERFLQHVVVVVFLIKDKNTHTHTYKKFLTKREVIMVGKW
jgi:hypothetical protein